MNYVELRTAVASFYLNSQIDSTIPTFVRLAESVLRRDMRVPAMEEIATGSMVGGVLDLPSDYVDASRLVVDGYPLSFVTSARFQDLQTNGDVTSGSAGRYYTRIGNALHVLNGGAGSYSLLYMAAFPALAADTDTNWALTNASDVYLFKTLTYAAIFMKDAEAATGYDSLYQGALRQLNDSERINRYSGGTLSMPIGAPV